ncbi:hypothetical protein J4E91_007677 [Alternaria rosae]|nr:hypothetical protein J4E91_007677 [Alternaria rosae]
MSTSLDTTESKLCKLEDLLDKSTTLRGLLPPNTDISKITPHGTSHWTSCFRAGTTSTPHRHSTFTRAPRGLIGLQYLPSNGSRNDNATAQHESSRNPDEKNEKRLEGEQDTERRDKSYFVKVAQGKNGMSMLRGECESAADMKRMMPGFCVKGVGWGVLGEESKGEEQSGEDGDDDENDDARQQTKWHFYIQNFTPMRSPTTSGKQLLAHQLALLHAKNAENCSDLNYCGRPEGRFF